MPYPNQKKITIHKPKYKKEFMQVGIEEWQEAFKRYCKHPEEKTSVLGMYLYLASNADGHEKWLSPAAYTNATGKSRASYYRALEILEEDGYIYKDQGGGLNFATTPQMSTEIVCHDWEGGDSRMRHANLNNKTEESQECNSAVSGVNIEINNIDINKEKQIEIDKVPSLDFSYLRNEVDADGGFDGTSFQKIIPRFEKVLDPYKVKRIAENTRFSEEEAYFIVYEILSDKWRIKEYGWTK